MSNQIQNTIKNRSEILFLYDVTDGNPNGDPHCENQPRIDIQTNINIVTDVRLKRTIRNYLQDYKNLEIFVKEERDSNGKLKTKEDILKKYKNIEEIKEKCIDVRLFGATIAVKDQSAGITGPVQFKIGRSMHKVDGPLMIKGTTVMPSKEGKGQGTFTEKYILPYSLISFYGIINENAVRTQNLPLSENDVDLLMEAIWYGTNNLCSCSKFGQTSRFLLQIVYKEKTYFVINELDKKIKFKSEKADEQIRNITDGKIDMEDLINAIKENKKYIEKIRFKKDERCSTIQDLSTAIEGIKIEKFNFEG